MGPGAFQKIHMLPLLGTESGFHGRPARNKVTVIHYSGSPSVP